MTDGITTIYATNNCTTDNTQPGDGIPNEYGYALTLAKRVLTDGTHEYCLLTIDPGRDRSCRAILSKDELRLFAHAITNELAE